MNRRPRRFWRGRRWRGDGAGGWRHSLTVPSRGRPGRASNWAISAAAAGVRVQVRRPSAQVTRRSRQAPPWNSNWRIGRASRNSLASKIIGPPGTLASVSCQCGRSPRAAAWAARRTRRPPPQSAAAATRARRRRAGRPGRGAAAGTQFDQVERRGRAHFAMSTAQRPSSSPNIWEISGAVTKSPVRPSGRES